jgi:flagellar basal body-associated protein FliL
MKKRTQSGFATVELVLLVVILIAIAGVGYYVWYGNQKTSTTTATNTSSSTSSGYQSPSVATPTAPQVNNASDLNSAMSALNQTSVSSSNADSNQLTTEASGF